MRMSGGGRRRGYVYAFVRWSVVPSTLSGPWFVCEWRDSDRACDRCECALEPPDDLPRTYLRFRAALLAGHLALLSTEEQA